MEYNVDDASYATRLPRHPLAYLAATVKQIPFRLSILVRVANRLPSGIHVRACFLSEYDWKVVALSWSLLYCVSCPLGRPALSFGHDKVRLRLGGNSAAH